MDRPERRFMDEFDEDMQKVQRAGRDVVVTCDASLHCIW